MPWNLQTIVAVLEYQRAIAVELDLAPVSPSASCLTNWSAIGSRKFTTEAFFPNQFRVWETDAAGGGRIAPSAALKS